MKFGIVAYSKYYWTNVILIHVSSTSSAFFWVVLMFLLRPALGPIQLPTQWVAGTLSLGVKRPGREVD